MCNSVLLHPKLPVISKNQFLMDGDGNGEIPIFLMQ